MRALEEVMALQSAGRFRDAFNLLESARMSAEERTQAEVVRAELLEAIGQLTDAKDLARRLLDRRDRLAIELRSACECVLGKVARENGEYTRSVEHLQR